MAAQRVRSNLRQAATGLVLSTTPDGVDLGSSRIASPSIVAADANSSERQDPAGAPRSRSAEIAMSSRSARDPSTARIRTNHYAGTAALRSLRRASLDRPRRREARPPQWLPSSSLDLLRRAPRPASVRRLPSSRASRRAPRTPLPPLRHMRRRSRTRRRFRPPRRAAGPGPRRAPPAWPRRRHGSSRGAGSSCAPGHATRRRACSCGPPRPASACRREPRPTLGRSHVLLDLRLGLCSRSRCVILRFLHPSCEPRQVLGHRHLEPSFESDPATVVASRGTSGP